MFYWLLQLLLPRPTEDESKAAWLRLQKRNAAIVEWAAQADKEERCD